MVPALTVPGASGVRIFVSYAHADTALKDELLSHLAFLQRLSKAIVFHDGLIGAGVEWMGALRRAIDDAQIFLLLVSPDFIASDFIDANELSEILSRHSKGTAHVIPIILRPCKFDDLPLGKLQAVPLFGKPVTTHDDRDTAFVEIVTAVEKVVQSKLLGPA